jgi:t-SNARE complex subunit (syntaxin)
MTPELLFRKICVRTLQSRVIELIRKVQKTQLEMKSESQKKLKERVRMYDNQITEEELEDLVNDPEVITKKFLMKENGEAH